MLILQKITRSFVMDWPVLIISLVFLSAGLLMGIGMVIQARKTYQESLNQLKLQMKDQNEAWKISYQSLMEQNKDLLNRMMSKDLPTYSTMTALHQSLVISNDPYIPQGDAFEAKRYADLAGSQGLGDTNYEDAQEFGSMLGEFGLTPRIDGPNDTSQ